MSKLLDYRNAVYDAVNNLIDLEVESAEHGWIPTTFIVGALDVHQEDIFSQLDIERLPRKDNTIPFDMAVARKVVEVKKLRTLALEGAAETVTTSDGNRWQINTSAIDDLTRTITLGLALGALPQDTYWRDVENVSHPASLDLLKEIAALAAVRHTAIWKASWEHIDAIRKCASQEELDAYALPSIL